MDKKTGLAPIIVVITFATFLALGLPDGLIGVAWPTVRHEFGHPVQDLWHILIPGTIGYILAASLSGSLYHSIGTRGMMICACLFEAAGLTGIALSPWFYGISACAMVAGFGGGLIDSGLNHFSTIKFPTHFMYLLHASFGMGATIGPELMKSSLQNLETWRYGYVPSITLYLALVVGFLVVSKGWSTQEPVPEKRPRRMPAKSTIRMRSVWLAMLAFACMTGTEYTVGQWTYTLLSEGRGIDSARAAHAVSLFWACFTLGRIGCGLLASKIARFVSLAPLLLALATGLLALNLSVGADIIAVALAGLGLAPMFPTLMSSTETRVGIDHAANTIGFQIGAAALSTALCPAVGGLLIKAYGLEVVPKMACVIASVLVVLWILLARSHQPILESNDMKTRTT